MRYLYTLIAVIIFFPAKSQVGKGKNRDEKYLNLVESYNLNPDTIKLLKTETNSYEKFIGKNPRKDQKINLSAGKMFLEIYLNDENNPKVLSQLCKRVIDNIGQSEDYPRFLSIAYRYYAQCMKRLGARYETVVLCYNKSIEVARKAHLYSTQGATYRLISQLSEGIYDYEEALRYNDSARVYMSKDMKARYYISSLKFDRLLLFLKLYRQGHQKKYLDSADTSIRSFIKERGNLSITYGFKAYSDFFKKNYKTALASIDSAAHYSTIENNYLDHNDYRDGLRSLIYFKMNDFAKGEFYIKKINIENLTPDHLLYEILYQELYIQSKKHGRYKEALDFYEKHNEIQKRNYFTNNQLQVRKFKEKLKVAEKDVQLAKLQNNRKELIVALVIIFNVLLISAAFTVVYFRRKKNELKKAEYNIKSFTENEIYKINYAKEQAVNNLRKQFSTQLHNDVGGILVATTSFLKSKKKMETKEEDKELWDDIATELQKVYNIVREDSHNIYSSSFDTGRFLSDIENNIRIIFSGQFIDLHTHINIDKDKTLTPETKLCILTIIREACTNILKYAKAKNVFINLLNDDENLYLEIRNDDKRKNNKTERSSLGIGLSNLKEKISVLGGHFSANKLEDGFLVSTEIPLK